MDGEELVDIKKIIDDVEEMVLNMEEINDYLDLTMLGLRYRRRTPERNKLLTKIPKHPKWPTCLLASMPLICSNNIFFPDNHVL